MKFFIIIICCVAVFSVTENNVFAESEYLTINLSNYSTHKINWPYEKISTGSYTTNKENVPFYITNAVKFDYDSGSQTFPVDVKISQAYVFLNSINAGKAERGSIVGRIVLNFENDEQIRHDVIVGKNIRNFETNFIATEDYSDDWIYTTDDSSMRPVYSQQTQFLCKDYNYDRDICSGYYHPDFEQIDMLTLSVPITHVGKILKNITLEGNTEGYTNAFVSAITVKKYDGVTTIDNWFLPDGNTLVIGALFAIIIIVSIILIMRNRARRSTRVTSQQPRGSFSKEDGTFTP